MPRLPKLSLPAIAASAPLPTEGDARRPPRAAPIVVGEADRPGAGRALVLVDRRPETLGSSHRDPDGQVLELVPIAPESATRGHGPAGSASLWLSAQLYGQGTGPSQAATIEAHRDGPRIGAAAYRRAAAESQDDLQQSVVFNIVV